MCHLRQMSNMLARRLSRRFSTFRWTLQKEQIEIEWPTKLRSTFDYMWLRDHCQCPKCVHPSTRQKLHSSSAVDPNVEPTVVHETKDNKHVQIEWNDKHVSMYSFDWLKRYDYSAAAQTLRRGHNSPQPWSRTELLHNNRLSQVNYNDFISSEPVLYQVLHGLHRDGIAILLNAPTDKDDLPMHHITSRIGPLRNTFYGPTWDVKNVTYSKNIAYTNIELKLHMDLEYFECPPGLQFLHCLEHSQKGGESMFLDVYRTVQELKNVDPQAYETLCEVPLTFHYHNDNRHYRYIRTLIEPESLNEPMRVNYAPPFQAPLDAIPTTLVREFYRSYRVFDKILERDDLIWETKLERGTCVIFHNRRVLHGRRSFHENGNIARIRHLKGAYVEFDDFRSRYRVLREKYDSTFGK